MCRASRRSNPPVCHNSKVTLYFLFQPARAADVSYRYVASLGVEEPKKKQPKKHSPGVSTTMPAGVQGGKGHELFVKRCWLAS